MNGQFLLLVIACAIMYLVPEPSRAEQSVPRSILLVDQSDGKGPFYFALFSSFLSTVNASSSPPPAVYAEGLDLARFRGRAYEDGLQEFFRSKYRDKPVGVVVAVGAASLDYVLRWRSQLWPESAIVFTIVDEKSFVRLNPPSDVTGHIITRPLSDAISIARLLVPDLKRVAFVGSAWESQTAYAHWKDEIQEVPASTEVIDLMGLPLQQLRHQVSSLPDHTAILYTSITSDGERAVNPPADAITLLAETANRPIVVAAETFVGRGATGGIVVQPSLIGSAAARLAMRILNGESASNIPVKSEDVARPIFDWRQMRRWNIDEARLPPGTEIRFRDPTAWEQYSLQILAVGFGVLLQAGLIFWLVYEHRRRNLAEAQSRQSMADLTYLNRTAGADLLSASLAHEINQPLTAIVTRANAALRWLTATTPDPEKVHAALTQIVEAGHRTAKIVTNVKSMFRKDAQQIGTIDINKLIQSVLAMLSFELRNYSIETDVRLDETAPPMAGNFIQLQQVIVNLVMNAIEAMTVAHPRILSIRSELNPDYTVRVAIGDSGSGIDPSDMDRIFKPLFTTKERGMGMGLAICRSIIESHGGRISVSPRVPRGTIFQIQLPLAKAGTNP